MTKRIPYQKNYCLSMDDPTDAPEMEDNAFFVEFNALLEDVQPQINSTTQKLEENFQNVRAFFLNINGGIEAEYAICDKCLGLEEGTRSTVEDVIVCIIKLKSANHLATLKNQTVTGTRFYDEYLHPSVSRAWELYCKRHRGQNNGVLSKTSGRCLFGYDTKDRTEESSMRMLKYEDIIEEVGRLCEYLRQEAAHHKLTDPRAPVLAKVRQYVKSKSARRHSYDPSDSLSLDDDEKMECDASISSLVWERDFPSPSGVEAELKEMLAETDVDTPTTFADLLKSLQVELNDKGRVIMPRHDWTTFHNSLIVNSMFFSNVMRHVETNRFIVFFECFCFL